MSSSRAARVFAGLGLTGVIAASGLALTGPASADAPATTPVTTAYSCTLAGQTFSIPTTLDLPAIPAGSYVVGDTIPQLPIASGTITIPSDLQETLIDLASTVQQYTGVDLSKASLGGDILGQSTIGTENVPTSVTVPSTPLAPLFAAPDPTQLPPLVISGLTGTVGNKGGTPLTAAGTKPLPVSLPTQITADLIPAIDPLLGAKPVCTVPSAPIGQLTVAKAKSEFSSVKLVPTKVSSTKRATVKAAMANASVPGSSVKPDGTVSAYVGSKKVGSGTLKKGAASFALAKLKKVVYKVTVKYTGSKNFTGAASKTVKLTVTK